VLDLLNTKTIQSKQNKNPKFVGGRGRGRERKRGITSLEEESKVCGTCAQYGSLIFLINMPTLLQQK
jgi:hypothetical protein